MDSAIPNVEVNDQLIELLRSHLDSMIAKHGTNSLLHPDIVHFSQLLDKFIAAYTMNSMKKRKHMISRDGFVSEEFSQTIE